MKKKNVEFTFWNVKNYINKEKFSKSELSEGKDTGERTKEKPYSRLTTRKGEIFRNEEDA